MVFPSDELINRLQAIGVGETKASVESKISRGTFSVAFLLECLSAIGCKNFVPEVEIFELAVAEPRTVLQSKVKKVCTMIYNNTNSEMSFIDISDFPFGKNGMQFPVVSLFSGARGLDIGFEESGFHTALGVEYDTDCREILRYNRPEWRLFEEGVKIEKGKMKTRMPGDVRDIGVDELFEVCRIEKR